MKTKPEFTASIVILSDKSSGSSILQNVLGRHPNVSRICENRFNYESKYWAYSTAILGLPQPVMEYSHEFPVKKSKAIKSINDLFRTAGIVYQFGKSPSKIDVFRGWTLLSKKHSPIFLEKSPHHLHYWDSLQLMNEYRLSMNATPIKFIGLIRNPMDTLFSMWQRWYAIPNRRQYEWLRAYENMLEFKSIVGKDMLIIKYEDFVEDPETLNILCDFIGIDADSELSSTIHRNSVQKWRIHKNFGFVLDDCVKKLALQFYTPESLHNTSNKRWTILQFLSRPRFRLLITKGHFINRIKRFIKLILRIEKR